MRIIPTTVALALAAGAANAGITAASGLEVKANPFEASSGGAFPTVDIDLSGRVHNNVLNSEWNNVIRLDLGGTDFQITGVAWDLEATTRAGVALSELRFAVFNSDGEGIVFNPFDGNDTIGSGQAVSTMHNLLADGMAFDSSNGEVFIELYLPRNLVAGAEGWYSEGSFLSLEYTTVPTPGTLAMLGLGGLAAARRRR